jgi:hypothetical protein
MKPTNIEVFALKLLRALKKEYDREPSLLNCKLMKDIAVEIRFSQDEYDRATRHLFDRHLVDVTNRPDGMAGKPNQDGFDYLEAHKSKKWTRSEILTVVGIILTILGLVVGITQCRHGAK